MALEHRQLHGVLRGAVAGGEVGAGVDQSGDADLGGERDVGRQQRDRQRDVVVVGGVVQQTLALVAVVDGLDLLIAPEEAQIVHDNHLEAIVGAQAERVDHLVLVSQLDQQRKQVLRSHQLLVDHEIPAEQTVGMRAVLQQPLRLLHVARFDQIVKDGSRIHAAVAGVHVGTDLNKTT